jgi:hypothetical protein
MTKVRPISEEKKYDHHIYLRGNIHTPNSGHHYHNSTVHHYNITSHINMIAL